ncbi:outer membrane protein assembly factor BamE [Exilibacterium tricleocarpae]|uniref:Outer membrane protein assembly factor BamE n=1 Tax=Exilibacterium tricleocarpae TaxID=2591008 RepID=A0A545TBD9_9GAMM|nr:outer membrane protein assembly factor BamE [Exilibacterium tricleocarpae]TQV74525.1 outer membrane protein assembly factor BamE [Exilibacterium tricleocarpae]
MQKAFRLLAGLFLVTPVLLGTAGCSYFQFPGVYKIDVQQGNIITQEMIDQLKPGMTKRQVRFIMGTPLVADTFHRDRWDYYFSFQDPDGNVTREMVTMHFKDDKLTHFSGDYRPSPATRDQTAGNRQAP